MVSTAKREKTRLIHNTRPLGRETGGGVTKKPAWILNGFLPERWYFKPSAEIFNTDYNEVKVCLSV